MSKRVGSDIRGRSVRLSNEIYPVTPEEVRDPVADALVAALWNLKDDKNIRLGRKGYVVRRAKGKGASGFVAQKLV